MCLVSIVTLSISLLEAHWSTTLILGYTMLPVAQHSWPCIHMITWELSTSRGERT